MTTSKRQTAKSMLRQSYASRQTPKELIDAYRKKHPEIIEVWDKAKVKRAGVKLKRGVTK